MKHVIVIFAMLMSMSAFAGLGSNATTSVKQISKIDIQRVGGEVYYYFTAEGDNWNSSNCPNAKSGFIKQSEIGADAFLSVALMAKASDTPVQLRGICGNGAVGGTSDAYLYIDYITLDPI
ncbi:hypothetical protein [Shewanella sp. YLB-07]|uniref:hypothetical protein n=1 Tax=Shewanella sp. YLB-07 TaxID=2601268 RepID=UPI00128B0E18|nr:hypothetical protein [Shewanella sp. YLB-07]MPY24344.1 hypothetical protein [Shewanella sp. YLB-07]